MGRPTKTDRKVDVTARFQGHPAHWYILTDEQEKKLRKLWSKHAHVREIAKECGLSRDQMSYFRLKLKLTRTRRVYRSKSISEDEENLIQIDYMLKKSLKFIARKYDKSLHTLGKLVKERGWANRRNPQGGRIQVRSYWTPPEHAILQEYAFKYGATVPTFLVKHFIATRDAKWPLDTATNSPPSSVVKETVKSR